MLRQAPPETVTESPLRGRRPMLRPEAYDAKVMPSLRLARSSRKARWLGRILTVMLIAGFFLALFAPWQQFVRGSGSVTAFNPAERPQVIEAPIKGRIVRMGENIYENAVVQEGDLIVEIQDLDAMLVERIEDQLEVSRNAIEQMRMGVAAAELNREQAERQAEWQKDQVETYRRAKGRILEAAEAAIKAAKAKVESAEKQKQFEQAVLQEAKLNYERQKVLSQRNAVSEKVYQQTRRKRQESEAKLAKAQADLEAARAELVEKIGDRDSKEEKAQAEIEYAQVQTAKALGDVEKAKQNVNKANADIQKATKELRDLETKASRQASQQIRAPFDGIITQITPNQGSAFLKEGSKICTIVPETKSRAVQIWLDGNDASLVEPGRHVRLQFEGWPAVQFAGWPSVAIGTFGGEVVSVDATDAKGDGKFRVLVEPFIGERSPEWPQGRFLRQGVRANGWVLLEEVPLWFEIWRQMNGFPPVVEEGEQTKVPKGPKLPKV